LKKNFKALRKKQMAAEICCHGSYSISRACKILNLGKATVYYKTKKDDTEVMNELRLKADLHPREGFWKAFGRIRLEGNIWNHKRVHRIYKEMKLNIRRKGKRRLPARAKETLMVPAHINHTWSIDFMHDALMNGRKFKTFNVIDDYNREILRIEINHSLKSNAVVLVLNRLIKQRTKPQIIRMDNGPEFIAGLTNEWSKMHKINFHYIQISHKNSKISLVHFLELPLLRPLKNRGRKGGRKTHNSWSFLTFVELTHFQKMGSKSFSYFIFTSTYMKFT